MPVAIKDKTYYRTAEVYRMVGISRNTVYRWPKEGGTLQCRVPGLARLAIIYRSSSADHQKQERPHCRGKPEQLGRRIDEIND